MTPSSGRDALLARFVKAVHYREFLDFVARVRRCLAGVSKTVSETPADYNAL